MCLGGFRGFRVLLSAFLRGASVRLKACPEAQLFRRDADHQSPKGDGLQLLAGFRLLP